MGNVESENETCLTIWTNAISTMHSSSGFIGRWVQARVILKVTWPRLGLPRTGPSITTFHGLYIIHSSSAAPCIIAIFPYSHTTITADVCWRIVGWFSTRQCSARDALTSAIFTTCSSSVETAEVRAGIILALVTTNVLSWIVDFSSTTPCVPTK